MPFPIPCLTAAVSPAGRGSAFIGPLDAYTTNLVALYSPFQRLLTAYAGQGIRVRRSSDSTLQWIGFNADGTFDSVSYLAFIGAGNGFAHTVADQSGNGRDVTQTTAAAQPQIGVDGDGNYYLYAPGAGFTKTRLWRTGLSVSSQDFTFWTVAGAAAYALAQINTRYNATAKERSSVNYSNSLLPYMDESGTGTVATITSTNTGVYSTVWAGGSGGNKLTNRLSTTTGTRAPVAHTINEIGVGSIAGGATWAQNSPWYLGGLWSEDKGGSADFAALSTLGKTLIAAAQ